MNLPPKPKNPVSLSVLAARANASKSQRPVPNAAAAPTVTPTTPQEVSTLVDVRAKAGKRVEQPEANALTVTASGRQRTRHRDESRAQMLERLTNPLISLHEASVLLRVCTATVRHYTDSGELPHVRTVGGQRRFYLRDVLALLRQQEARRQKK